MSKKSIDRRRARQDKQRGRDAFAPIKGNGPRSGDREPLIDRAAKRNLGAVRNSFLGSEESRQTHHVD